MKQAPVAQQQVKRAPQASGDGVGEILIRDVVLPVVNKVRSLCGALLVTSWLISKLCSKPHPQTVSQAKSAVDLQALHSIQQGFQTLSRDNPELANQMMIDIMSGLRE